ncbi:hypothetical protein [Mycolicibacterium sediminis]|uniref:Lipoprotein LppJ n=1 Tax=Mycolicibacterium sediminis TaxID=1286180 RepID=A0A7I7QP84_9MYCO|nr:hypothetical protein [Mycolicibacterium sediminis]BBY28131.1 hypothetical protein MSEDJ_22270 [Mycolicibacterium sediminis]
MSKQTARVTTVAVLAAALLSGCGVVSTMKNEGVKNPITPEQSKAQVIDAAKEVVSTLGIEAIRPAFWHASCNDQGEAPFRGQMRIGYPQAGSFEASDAEIASMVQRLESNGWSKAPDFLTHGTALQKNGIVAVFSPQNVSVPTRSLEFFGECSDVTTSKEAGGETEIVSLTP